MYRETQARDQNLIKLFIRLIQRIAAKTVLRNEFALITFAMS